MSTESSDFRSRLNMYEFETKLPGTGEALKFKPITTRQLKRLLLWETAEDIGKIEDALDELIKECVVSPSDFDVGNVYLQDRFFLLLELRKVTKGNMYTFQAICQECGGQFMQSVNLATLSVSNYHKIAAPKLSKAQKQVVKTTTTKKGKEEKVPEVEEKKLPSDILEINDKMSLEMKMLTRGIQRDAFKFVAALPKLSDAQKRLEAISVMHAQCIKSVIYPDKKFDNLPLEDKLYMLDNITPAETEKIIKWFDDSDFGVDFQFTQVCPHCKAEIRREVPLEDFFS